MTGIYSSKKLKQYLKNREVSINIILKKPRVKYSKGTYHQLRLEIKKLNALFDLINYCTKDFRQRKTFKPFKMIFRQAGKIREIQLEETILKKHLPGKFLMNYQPGLKRKRLQEQNLFFSKINKNLLSLLKSKFEIVVPTISKVKVKEINNYLDKKTNIIKKLLTKSTIKTQDIHVLRKRIKVLNYNRKSLALNNQNNYQIINDDFAVLLGKWHDCRVLLNHLEKSIKSGEMNSKESIQILKLKSIILQESKLLFKKIKLYLKQVLTDDKVHIKTL